MKIARKDLEPWLLQRAKTPGRPRRRRRPGRWWRRSGEDAGAARRGASEQLAGAFPGQRITPADRPQQFRGLGEQKIWDLCDRAFGKDLPGAIRLAALDRGGRRRRAHGAGRHRGRLRDLMRVRALPDRMPPAQLAKAAGLAVRLAGAPLPAAGAQLLAGASSSRSTEQVAEADRALKSGATGDVVMPVLIASIAAVGRER